MSDAEFDLPTQRALAALDEMAAAWAVEAKIDAMCAATIDKDDAETRFAALVKQGYVEGGYNTLCAAKDGKIPSLMLRAEHDRCVAELLTANNAEVERRREAERRLGQIAGAIELLDIAIGAGDPAPEIALRINDIRKLAAEITDAG